MIELDKKTKRLQKLYLNYLLTEKGLSDNTIYSYKIDLNQFFRYIIGDSGDVLNLSEVERADLLKFIKTLSSSKNGNLEASFLENTTISRKISSLKSFFHFLSDANLIDTNPASDLEILPKSNYLPVVLTQEEIVRLFEVCDQPDRYSQRNKAILQVMYSSGLRASEVLDMKLSWILEKESLLRVTGKGSKERIVPLGQKTGSFLLNYLKTVRPQFLKENSDDYVFLNSRGGRLSRMGLWKIIKSINELSGLQKDVHPHTIRHTFATHLIQGGADIRAVQEMLGHSDVSTTQIYTHIDASQLQKAHKSFLPRI